MRSRGRILVLISDPPNDWSIPKISCPDRGRSINSLLTGACRATPNKSKGGGWRHARQGSPCPLNPPTFRDPICEGAEATGSAVNLAVLPPLHHLPGVPRPRLRPTTSTPSLRCDVVVPAPSTTTTPSSSTPTTASRWPTTPKLLLTE